MSFFFIACAYPLLVQTFEPGSDVPSKQRIPNETFNCDDLKEIVVLVPSQDQQQQPQLEQSNPQNAPYGGYYPEFHGQVCRDTLLPKTH